MTALSADRDPGYCGERKTQEFPLFAGQTIYKGAFVCLNATGYLVEAFTTAGLKFVGVSLGDYRNGTGTIVCVASADHYATVESHGVFKAACSGLAITDIGKPCWFVDDQTVTLTPGNVYAGILADFESATVALVDITTATRRRVEKHRLVFTGNATATGAVQSAMEFSRKMQLKRWYFDVLTAPGGTDTCTCVMTDGTTAVTATITAAAVHAEDEAVVVAPWLADTDISITFARSGAAAATPVIVLELEEL